DQTPLLPSKEDMKFVGYSEKEIEAIYGYTKNSAEADKSLRRQGLAIGAALMLMPGPGGKGARAAEVTEAAAGRVVPKAAASMEGSVTGKVLSQVAEAGETKALPELARSAELRLVASGTLPPG